MSKNVTDNSALIENDKKMSEEIKVLNKRREKIENVLKQATDALVLALSV